VNNDHPVTIFVVGQSLANRDIRYGILLLLLLTMYYSGNIPMCTAVDDNHLYKIAYHRALYKNRLDSDQDVATYHEAEMSNQPILSH
jgi:hypothetical protein